MNSQDILSFMIYTFVVRTSSSPVEGIPRHRGGLWHTIQREQKAGSEAGLLHLLLVILTLKISPSKNGGNFDYLSFS